MSNPHKMTEAEKTFWSTQPIEEYEAFLAEGLQFIDVSPDEFESWTPDEKENWINANKAL